jgi:hypothetical protein
VNLKATRSDAGRTAAPQDVHARRDELHDELVNKTRYFIKLKGNLFSSISEISCVAGATLAMLLSLFVDDRALVSSCVCPRAQNSLEWSKYPCLKILFGAGVAQISLNVFARVTKLFLYEDPHLSFRVRTRDQSLLE